MVSNWHALIDYNYIYLDFTAGRGPCFKRELNQYEKRIIQIDFYGAHNFE